jgi:exosortase A
VNSSPVIISGNRPVANEWQVIGVVVLTTILCVVALFWPTVASMIEVWKSSRTFGHGFLVLPAACYLVWCYRHKLTSLTPAPSGLGVLALIMTGTGWLLGHLTNLLVLQQAAVVASIPSLVWAILGTKIMKALAWPLGFLIFLLPVGTSIEPWLQDFTASFILFGLDLTGVQYLYEDHRIIIASGTWDVARDCGGLRYLLPGLALAYAFATLIYRHPARRLVFLVLCAAVLMLANGVRAYGVIISDHFGYVEGADHRLFSYMIYGITIPLLYWLGLKCSEPKVESPVRDATPIPVFHNPRKTMLMAVASLAVLAIAPLSVWLWMGRQ